jgi:Skp family chaperone for outer membrane proteins
MRVEKLGIVAWLLVFCLSITVGCKRSGEPQAPAPTPEAGQAAAVDTEKPVAEIQAQAQTMSVESLKATALKYKEAITAKQAELEKLAAKIKEIPLTEALGEEAKTLKTDLQNLEASVKALKDRFQVYYDALKAKGADLSGLTL